MEFPAKGTDLTPESRLIARIVAGDPKALAEAFELHSARVFRLAYGITGSVSDSEDIVQDIFAALPERLTAFEGRSTLATWLHRIAVRSALLRTRRPRLLEHLSAELLARRPVSEATRHIDRVALERALGDLRDEYRVVVWLKVVEGWSHADIAGACGITENASYQRLYRAKRLLRAALGEDR